MALIALTGWYALILQLYLIIQVNVKQGTLLTGILNYFSYFTILCNLLVALCMTCCLIAPSSKWGTFFLRVTVQTAIAVYIMVVGITYSIALRNIWDPQGLQLLADRLLHDVIPIVYVVYWFVFAPRGDLVFKHINRWLYFPAIYLAYSMIRGAITGRYPYPFLDAGVNGPVNVLISIVVIFVTFVIISALLVLLNRLLNLYN